MNKNKWFPVSVFLFLLLVSPMSFSSDIGFIFTDKKENESTLYKPASVIKVLTAYLAINYYGLDKRFSTDFYYTGNDRLVLRSEGDPFFTGEDVEKIADMFVAKGKTSIKEITIDISRTEAGYDFEDNDDTNNPYNSPVAPVVLNFNTVTFNNSGDAGEDHTPLVQTAKDLYKPGIKRASLLTAENAIRYYSEVFDAIFKKKGIVVERWTMSSDINSELYKSAELMLSYKSDKTLSDILKGMLKYSNNSIANQLAVILVFDNYNLPVTQTGIEVYYQAMLEKIVGKSLDNSGVVISDGSGLNRKSKLSPEIMLAVMKVFEPYQNLLTDNKKTGTMKGIRNIVGYRNNEPYVVFCNDCSSGFNREKYADELTSNSGDTVAEKVADVSTDSDDDEPEEYEDKEPIRPEVTPPDDEISTGDKEHVLIIGDSLIYGPFGKSLENELKTVGFKVTRYGKSSSGLARPDFFDWSAKADELLSADKYDKVIVLIGTNDAQDVNGKRFGTPSWEEAYTTRVKDLYSKFQDSKVYWFTPPRMKQDKFNNSTKKVASVIKSACVDNCTPVDFYTITEKDEKYDASVRTTDGIHFNQEGGGVIAKRFMELNSNLFN